MNEISRPWEEITGVITSVLSLNLKLKIWLSAVIGGFTFGAVTHFIDNYVYYPYLSYFMLIGIIFADHFTGMYLAFKGNRFETRKALRIFWTMLSHSGLLVFANNLATGDPALGWLDDGVFVPLCLVNLLSLIKNLSLLGWIKKEFADFLYRKIDTYKNDYIKYKEEQKKEEEKKDEEGSTNTDPHDGI